MKNILTLLAFIAQLVGSIWLLAVEGWLSGLLFFILTTVFIAIMLSFHDAVAALFQPRR